MLYMCCECQMFPWKTPVALNCPFFNLLSIGIIFTEDKNGIIKNYITGYAKKNHLIFSRSSEIISNISLSVVHNFSESRSQRGSLIEGG